jgi:hypothetical protein
MILLLIGFEEIPAEFDSWIGNSVNRHLANLGCENLGFFVTALVGVWNCSHRMGAAEKGGEDG